MPSAAPAPQIEAPPTSRTRSGALLPSRYRVLRPLGSGAAGAVHLAVDLVLDRLVAVKVLRGARPRDLERFRREARLMARLDDPAIARVFDLDEHRGRSFIVMEYVEGGSLAEARLAPLEVARVGRACAEALQRVHDLGVVHRDVKPENVLLERDGRVRLTDFGLAADLAAEAAEPSRILGTPTTMSPEQARGDLASVDGRSDVFSLGATLYDALTGARPFEGPNVADLLHAILHDEPRPPRELLPDLPLELEAIVLRCLAKRPEERFQTMGELARALGRLDEEPARGSWLRRLARRFRA